MTNNLTLHSLSGITIAKMARLPLAEIAKY
jgi:hypothetical protein